MISVSRQALATWGRCLSQRSFASASTPAMEKLSNIIVEQSKKNFNQGLPSNVITSIVDVTDEDEHGLLSAKSAKLALSTIEASDTRLTHEEAWDILSKELGVQSEDEKVPAEHFWRLVFFDGHSNRKMELW
mmetsp:Transcript_26345/g.47584  ORF Transcript_26345/g.47584 Transcript_26345/m.47584 type:complete len:132 (+) Transcript_26345:109-504(+)